MSEVEDSVDDTTRFMIELLNPIGPVVAKRLFGTWGLYLEDRIFGLVHDGITYFRTNARTVDKYLLEGARPFMYQRSDGRSTIMQYHEVPDGVLDDRDLACAWAYEAASD